MVEQTDRYGDVGKRKSVMTEVCNIVADEISAIAINLRRLGNIGCVAVESDIGNARQVIQESARPASYIQQAISRMNADRFTRKSSQPASCSNEMLNNLKDHWIGQQAPDTASVFTH